jgi:DNA-binding NarL/FixJ family response regulator
VRRTFEDELTAEGIRVDPLSRTKLLLDTPRGYALSTLDGMDRTGSKVIVVTWNSCPEYVEDLRDLRPDALLSDEFFLRQDSNVALDEVLRRVNSGGSYYYTPGPPTVLTPAERAVLRCVAQGWDNRRTSHHLHIGEQTVKNRLSRVYKKLGIHGQSEAVLYYWQVWQQPA